MSEQKEETWQGRILKMKAPCTYLASTYAPAAVTSPVANPRPVRSSLPDNEPTLIEENDHEQLLTPNEWLLPGDNRVAPPPRSSLPANQYGPRPSPLKEPSSIPSWSNPALDLEKFPETDRLQSQPIDPVMVPETNPLYDDNTGIMPPADAGWEKHESAPNKPPSPFPSSIPGVSPSSSPPSDIAEPVLEGGIKAE